eukprot:c4287_g1_i1.p1 GENE.c4287_g1_i1~~c4287_g1_i1.p1  ORF type:complete len:549 (-),score=128.24 c4287_g1_i1:15-1661(-)
MEGQSVAIGVAIAGVLVAFAIWRRQQLKKLKPRAPFRIIHFNDIYDVEERENHPIGAPKFATLLKTINQTRADGNALIVFSGDALSPSILSQRTLGVHMVEVLNSLGVHFACVGNHDLDFGHIHLQQLLPAFKFPWFLANVIDKVTKKCLCGAESSRIIEWNGYKVGIFGVVELEWLETIQVPHEMITGLDPVKVSRDLCQQLRGQGAEIIIAITHMREHNDYALAEAVPEIDVVLGGHDHHYVVKSIPHTDGRSSLVVKSGTDFRELSLVEVRIADNQRVEASYERFVPTPETVSDPNMVELIARYTEGSSTPEKVLGETSVALDSTFKSIRSKETNIANFVADAIQLALKTDVVLLNSGSFRADSMIQPGPFNLSHLSSLFPFNDPLVILQVSGAQLVAALENGVSQVPKLEGRFPAVSGIRFSYSPKREPGARVIRESVTVDGKPVQDNDTFSLATKSYLAKGKDGYDCFVGANTLVGLESLPSMFGIMVTHFFARDIALGWLNQYHHNHENAVQKAALRFRKKPVHDVSRAIHPEVDGRISEVE